MFFGHVVGSKESFGIHGTALHSTEASTERIGSGGSYTALSKDGDVRSDAYDGRQQSVL